MTTLEPCIWLTALLLGLAGNVHCFGMCGGIMAALSLRQEKPSFTILLAYNLGRILGYALIGGLFGGLIALVLAQWPAAMPAVRVLAGALLIAMGVYLAGWANWLAPLERVGQQIWKTLPKPSLAAIHHGHFWQAIGTGIVWGWLPCGLVYSALAWASSQGSPWQASALMALFGIGTLPAMLATGVLASRLQGLLRTKGFRQLTGLLVILFGIWTLGMPLLSSHQHHEASHQHEVSDPHSHHHP
ncbi:MAG: sulfite exporter TauE/SafE family protein [Gammaproteobacteria bacterium]|nr:MAG: sulfite exporter TauE/SafE family protein [Gammaproteobacteria bacterium]